MRRALPRSQHLVWARAAAALLFASFGAARNPACWAADYGYTPERCCPPELDPVGETTCWWDGNKAGGAIALGEYSYMSCCNDSGLPRTRERLSELMASATKLPYLLAERVVLELRDQGLLPSRFAVNLGAADGSDAGDDPVVPLFLRHGFGGLAVEPDEAKVEQLRRRMPPAVAVFQTSVTPENIPDLLLEGNAPAEPGFLKIDIDSFDCAVLLAALRVSRPAVAQIEVNSEVPFPVVFGVHYTPNFRHSASSGREHGWFSRGFFGCSPTLAVELSKPFGYDVTGQAGAHDVLLVRRDLRLALNARMPWAPLRAYTTEGVARAISVRTMKGYFGTGVGISWLMLAEARSESLLRHVRTGIEAACIASQGQGHNGKCPLPYTLGFEVGDFVRLY